MAATGADGSLSPRELRQLTDALVGDPSTILNRLVPANSASHEARAAHIHRWSSILDDAAELELSAAPSLGDCLRTAAESSLAIAGLGLAFTGPILGSVVATVSLVVGGLAGALTFRDAGA